MNRRQHVFPFVVGCPRSGTTLLRAMLDSHSLLAIPGESHFIPSMAHERDRYERADGFVTEVFVDDLFASDRFRGWRLPPASVRDALADSAPGSLADAFRTIYGAYAAHRGKPLYGDKTPGYVRELPVLADLFPEARFVHIVRDGRDVVLSLRDMDWAAQRGSLDTLARFWRTNIEFGRAARDDIGPDQYAEIRYEELVDEPGRVLEELCGWLEIPYERDMLAYHEQSGRPGDAVTTEAHHAHAGMPVTKGLRDWRTQMSPREVAQFDEVAGEMLELTGYPRGLG